MFISGLGPVGLAVGMIAQRLGARQVIGVDLSDHRVGIAKRVGAITDGLSSRGDEALEFVREQTGGELCEASFDCSGAAFSADLGTASDSTMGSVRAYWHGRPP